LKGETVKAKKYFYVLRPVLACRWVLDRGTPPPMLFSELASAELPGYLRLEVDRLLDLKINSPEIREIPRIDILNEYLEGSIGEIKGIAAESCEEWSNDMTELDELFLRTVSGE
ncbi:MAG: nucleotidyltransferase domain-containing protein, partial [Firmicutes bacterium]|nr:nucleotidyltransferase domain-containing protein [Bacillota bacterium]